MNYEEFRMLVKQMRAAQKEYFSTRNNEVLRQTKKLERKVDDALKIIMLPEAPTSKQKELF